MRSAISAPNTKTGAQMPLISPLPFLVLPSTTGQESRYFVFISLLSSLVLTLLQYVDITSDVVRTIMQNRLDLAVTKGCDGVEPDNVDEYTNDNGLGITAADQIDFNTFMASEVLPLPLPLLRSYLCDHVGPQAWSLRWFEERS